MSSKQKLMQPLRSDHLKPRPSTEASYSQAQSVQIFEEPAVVEEKPFEKEIAAFCTEAEEMPAPAEEPAAVEEPLPEAAEPAAESEQEALPVNTDRPVVFAEPVIEEKPLPEKSDLAASVARLLAGEALIKEEEPQPQAPVFEIHFDTEDDFCPPAEEKKAQELPQGSLGAAIAAILSSAEDDDDNDDEDNPAIHDAVPNRFLPEPACVPLFEEPAPKRSKRRWLWLLAPVIAAAIGYAVYVVINLP